MVLLAVVVVVVALSSASTRNSASQLPGAERVFRELVFCLETFRRIPGFESVAGVRKWERSTGLWYGNDATMKGR